MFKMVPIKYRAIYSDRGDEEQLSGFTPFRNDKNQWVYSRVIEIEPYQGGRFGCYLVVRVIDKVDTGSLTEPNLKETKVFEWVIWSNFSGIKESKVDIIANVNQSQLIEALAHQELRGRYVENIVSQLFIQLIVLNPKTEFERFLPEIKEFYEKRQKEWDDKKS